MLLSAQVFYNVPQDKAVPDCYYRFLGLVPSGLICIPSPLRLAASGLPPLYIPSIKTSVARLQNTIVTLNYIKVYDLVESQ